MLKDKTSPLGRAKKRYIIMFRHIEFAIGEKNQSKIWNIILELVNQRILQNLDLLKIMQMKIWPCFGYQYFEAILGLRHESPYE